MRRDWPTFPQLFINGEFVGGCDIVTDLYKSGELKKMLEDAGAIVHPEKKCRLCSTNSSYPLSPLILRKCLSIAGSVARRGLLLLREGHAQDEMVDGVAVEHVNRALRLLPTRECLSPPPLRIVVHEGEATASLCFEIGNHACSGYMAALAEQITQLHLRNVLGEVRHAHAVRLLLSVYRSIRRQALTFRRLLGSLAHGGRHVAALRAGSGHSRLLLLGLLFRHEHFLRLIPLLRTPLCRGSASTYEAPCNNGR